MKFALFAKLPDFKSQPIFKNNTALQHCMAVANNSFSFPIMTSRLKEVTTVLPAIHYERLSWHAACGIIRGWNSLLFSATQFAFIRLFTKSRIFNYAQIFENVGAANVNT